MSYQLPEFIDPETDEVITNPVLKFTAFRAHNEAGQFGLDGVEVSVYASLAASKSKRSRLKMDISAIEPSPLSAEAVARIKAATLGAIYAEYSAMGIFAEAVTV